MSVRINEHHNIWVSDNGQTLLARRAPQNCMFTLERTMLPQKLLIALAHVLRFLCALIRNGLGVLLAHSMKTVQRNAHRDGSDDSIGIDAEVLKSRCGRAVRHVVESVCAHGVDVLSDERGGK